MSTQAYSYAAQGNLQADLWACGSPAQAGAETANNRRFWTRTSQLFPATVRGRQELAPPSASQTIPGAVRVPRTGAAFDNPSWRKEPSGLRCPARQDGSPPQAKRSGPPRHRIERALRASRSRRLDRWPLPALATLPVTWRLPHSTGGHPITSKALRVKRVVGAGVPLPSHEDLPGSPPRAPGPALEKGHERQAGSGRAVAFGAAVHRRRGSRLIEPPSGHRHPPERPSNQRCRGRSVSTPPPQNPLPTARLDGRPPPGCARSTGSLQEKTAGLSGPPKRRRG